VGAGAAVLVGTAVVAGAAVVVGAAVVELVDVVDVVGATVVVVVVDVVDVVVVVVVVVDSTTLTVRPVENATIASESPMVPAVLPAEVVESEPRRPFVPLPQHFNDASSRTAHVCCAPALIATAVRPVPRLTACRASPISPEESPWLFWFP
jgi:hypothetical protein